MFDNQNKNNNNDGEVSDSEDLGRKKGADNTIKFNCDICHNDNWALPGFKRSEVKFLDSKEQSVLKFKKDRIIQVLCSQHYQNEVTNWFSKE